MTYYRGWLYNAEGVESYSHIIDALVHRPLVDQLADLAKSHMLHVCCALCHYPALAPWMRDRNTLW